jgi:hypothetical protein
MCPDGGAEKRCFKCHLVLPLDAFYRHPMMGDGHLGKCKECAKRDVTENRRKRAEQYSEYDRRRYQEPTRRAYMQSLAKEHARKNPEKHAARRIAGNAIKCGRLVRQPCVECRNQKSEAHHPDYSKPLEVVWLCRRCHMARHRKVS